MKDLLEKWKKASKKETIGFLKMLALPLIIVVLMAIVVAFDKDNQGDKDFESESAQVSTASEGESSEVGNEKKEWMLEENKVPEIQDLMETYFNARKTCDIEALSAVYGGTSSQEELDGLRTRLEEEVKFYRDFENQVYDTISGIEDGDYVVYARFDIKFRQAETLAPSMIVAYVKTAADGSCYLVAQPDEEQAAFMKEANESEAVQKLAGEVNENLASALNSDENLLAVYHALTSGTDEVSLPEESSTEETESASESGSSESQ